MKDALKRVPGVGDVNIFGERKYAMRVWLDPLKLAAFGLTATDVVSALQEQNVEIPAGQLGQQPADPGSVFPDSCARGGQAFSPEQFENIILKSTRNGLVLLKNVGHAEVGAEDYSSALEYNGHVAQGVGVAQLSNANALEVDRQAKAALEKLSKNFPPGLEYAIAFDSTTVVGDSIHEVLVTLAEAIGIVIAGDLPLPAGLARDDHSRRYDSCFADRNVRVHSSVQFLDQLADAVRNHAGHGSGGGRCNRGH